jgi:hypothetical protein
MLDLRATYRRTVKRLGRRPQRRADQQRPVLLRLQRQCRNPNTAGLDTAQVLPRPRRRYTKPKTTEMTVFSRSGLMPTLAPTPQIWRRSLVCTVALGCIVLAVIELIPKPPVVVAVEPAATFAERWDALYESPWIALPRPVRSVPIRKDEGRADLTLPSSLVADTPSLPPTPAPALPAAEPVVLTDTIKDNGKKTAQRQLAQQEVCAAHGLRKVWTSKWRWRCQR